MTAGRVKRVTWVKGAVAALALACAALSLAALAGMSPRIGDAGVSAGRVSLESGPLGR